MLATDAIYEQRRTVAYFVAFHVSSGRAWVKMQQNLTMDHHRFRAQTAHSVVDDYRPPETAYIQQYYNAKNTTNMWWTETAPYQPVSYSRNTLRYSNPLGASYASQNSARRYELRRQQTGRSDNTMLPGLHDERVHRKHRKQTNFENWFRDDPDWLLECICPADLCDMPCQWDEVGGCHMFRLCNIRQKYPHPIHGQRPPCGARTRKLCDGIHDIIEPSCRSLGKQIAGADSENWQFCSYQACEHVAKLASTSSAVADLHCRWGHDYEAARVVAIWMYWVHTALACRQGARGAVQRREDVYAWIPLQPDLGTLHSLEIIDNGAVEGFTFHDHKVVLPWDVYQHFSDRHERRAQTLENNIDETHFVEEGESSVNVDEPESWSPSLRRAASWSSLATSKQASRARSRSESMCT